MKGSQTEIYTPELLSRIVNSEVVPLPQNRNVLLDTTLHTKVA